MPFFYFIHCYLLFYYYLCIVKYKTFYCYILTMQRYDFLS
nr:MAG TPA: hypothetical protein [Caudoviricetes sp.]